MRKLSIVLIPLAFAYTSFAQDSMLRWKTIVGLTAPGVQNAVGGIPTGTFPWATTGGRAFVNLLNGRVRFRVEGLSVLGGDTIGTSSMLGSIIGTLVCTFGSTPVPFDTEAVPLSSQGDAEFDGTLDLSPLDGLSPSALLSCGNPRFLIRNPAGSWIAAGIVRTMRHEDEE